MSILEKVALSRINNSQKFSGKKIVCLGDSITGNYDYPTKMASFLGATVYNCGFAGTRMIGGQTHYDKFSAYDLSEAIVSGDFTLQDAEIASIPTFSTNLATLKSIDFSSIDALILFIGTNDYGAATAIGVNTDTTSTFMGGMNTFINRLLTAYPNLNLFFVTPMWRQRFNPDDGNNSDDYANTSSLFMIEYVNAMIEIANINLCPVLDMYRNCEINKYNYATYLVDGLHPTDLGETRLAEKISGFLNANSGYINYSKKTEFDKFLGLRDKESRDRVVTFDDFLYATFTQADTPWQLLKGNGAGTALGVIATNNGYGALSFVTGANSGIYSADGTQITSNPFTTPASGKIVIEAKFKINTAITNISICFGVTDTRNLEEPFEIGAGDVIVSNASNAACFVFDADADTKQWFACAVNADTDDVGNGATGYAPIASSYLTYRIEITDSGATVKFFKVASKNYILLKTLNNVGLLSSATVFPIFTVNTTGGTPTAKTVLLDYLHFSYDR